MLATVGHPVGHASPITQQEIAQQESLCPAPALSRVTRHTIASGETVESIAEQYGLIPATLLGFNPVLRSGNVSAGTEVLIPPYNGIQVEVPSGTTWQQLANTYNVRADALFEINGCQDMPSVVFIPGVNWSPTPSPAAAAPVENNPLNGYPLPAIAEVLTSYGWQLDPNTSEYVFQSGVNLQAEAGTPVFAVGSGTIAFAGSQDTYGNLVVINHSQGLQTRYAQLGSIAVQVGQQVSSGSQIGTVADADDGVDAGDDSSETRSYLHFEVRSNSSLGWVAQDPGVYIPDIRAADQIRRQWGNREE